jgi:DNA-binding NarL/FixJ family response regulator
MEQTRTLTRRQTQVVKLVCRGLTSKEIATKLRLSARTVEVYRLQASRALGVDNVADLVRAALRRRIVTVRELKAA